MCGVAAIILAAGGSTRMGRAKQLLEFQGQSLLRRAATVAIDAGCDPVIVVLGCESEAMIDELAELVVQPVVNSDWQRGIGTSIRRGIAHLMELGPDATATFIHLCDQPLVTAGSFHRLFDALEQSGKPVCVCSYVDTIGPPVLVGRELFSALLELPHCAGAKSLWTTNLDRVCMVPCPEAAFDADTPEEYRKLLDQV